MSIVSSNQLQISKRVFAFEIVTTDYNQIVYATSMEQALGYFYQISTLPPIAILKMDDYKTVQTLLKLRDRSFIKPS